MPYICAVIPQPSGTLSTDQGKQRPGWITRLGGGAPRSWFQRMERWNGVLLFCSALVLLLWFFCSVVTFALFCSAFNFPCLLAFLLSFSFFLPRGFFSFCFLVFLFFFLSCFSLCSFCMSLLCASSCIFFCYAAFCEKNHRSNSSLFCFSPLNIYHITWVFFIIWSIVLAFPLNTFYLYHSNLFCLFLFFLSLFWTFSYHLKPVSVCSLPVCLSFCCTFLPVTCFSFQPAPKRTTIATTTINI